MLDATSALITFATPGAVPWNSTPFTSDPNVLTSTGVFQTTSTGSQIFNAFYLYPATVTIQSDGGVSAVISGYPQGLWAIDAYITRPGGATSVVYQILVLWGNPSFQRIEYNGSNITEATVWSSAMGITGTSYCGPSNTILQSGQTIAMIRDNNQILYEINGAVVAKYILGTASDDQPGDGTLPMTIGFATAANGNPGLCDFTQCTLIGVP